MNADAARSTARYERWLDQFDASDRQCAGELVGALRFVTWAKVEEKLFKWAAAAAAEDRPVALFAAREVDFDSSGYFPDEPASGPRRLNADKPVGSEGDISHLIRDIVRQHRGSLLDHPGVAEMRRRRPARLVTVDDFVGSGNRMRQHLDWMRGRWTSRSGRTVRSWASSGHTTLGGVAYAGTAGGRRAVERRGWSVHYCDDSADRWRALKRDRRAAVRDLCRRYAGRIGKPHYALGYGGAFTRTVFSHKCPNTVPVILWSGRNGGRWEPLFEERPGRDESSWVRSPLTEPARAELLRRLGQTGLADADWEHHVEAAGRSRVLLLAAAAKGVRHADVLAAFTEVGVREAVRLRADCVRLGLIGPAGRPTAAGLELLRHVRRLGRGYREEPPPLTTEPYVPQCFGGQ